MSNIAIKVEHIYKKYGLYKKGAGTLRDTLANAWKHGLSTLSNRETFWALEDVSFEVPHGQVLGIIGRNGAGKSTLLKILSRITPPTKGRVELDGRVASLLEVGTGFHPELTGRENIFLNGTILGMSRAEIRQKFDEIVDFSGVERFLDAPVKHYSSGMYVRLAFAVAAHLEAEILLIDEVLAVGDAEFQKKCLGKMGELTNDGKAVLIVSHNKSLIRKLCSRIIIVEKSKMIFDGPANDAIIHYFKNSEKHITKTTLASRIDRTNGEKLKFSHISLLNQSDRQITEIAAGEELRIRMQYKVISTCNNVCFRILFYDLFGNILFLCNNLYSDESIKIIDTSGSITCIIPSFPLPEGEYSLRLTCFSDNGIEDDVEDVLRITSVKGFFFNSGRTPILKEGVFVQHYFSTNEETTSSNTEPR